VRVKKIISKSKDGDRMEVIAEDYHKNLKTLHVQRRSKKWKFCTGYRKGKLVLGVMQ